MLAYALVACDSGSTAAKPETPPPDPIIGTWDDPATGAGMECRPDGTVIDLSSFKPSGTWKLLSPPGRYEQRLDTGEPGGDPLVLQADLKQDLLRFDLKSVVSYRRRSWTPERPGPRGADVEGKFIALMSDPGSDSRVVATREYVELQDGTGLLLRRMAGWEFVKLDGTRKRNIVGQQPVNLELGHRYRLRGERYTLDEYRAEMKRVGHDMSGWTHPAKATGLLEVHEWIELEQPK